MGAVQPLGDDDDSPFLGESAAGHCRGCTSSVQRCLCCCRHCFRTRLTPRTHTLPTSLPLPPAGQLAPGSHSLSVESGLFRSLAHPYAPPSSDFLLIRAPAGTMQLRELSGAVTVGQQLPMMRVPAPTAREVK